MKANVDFKSCLSDIKHCNGIFFTKAFYFSGRVLRL